VLQQRSTKESLLLNERLHSFFETLKIHKVHLLDYGQEQQSTSSLLEEQWCFSRSKCIVAFGFYPTNWCEGLYKAIILRLMGSFTSRKSSNEHEFFIAVTFLNKIGEGRIRNLIGDVLFPVTFKCAMLIVIRKDPRPYWCIISNNILMCIKNRADLPRLWTEVLTPQVVVNRMSWLFHVYLNGHDKDIGTSTNDMAMTCKKEKTRGLNFCKDRKYESRSTDAGLKS